VGAPLQPAEESCPDPVAGQLLLMSCNNLSGKKQSYRTMQSLFVPVGAAEGDKNCGDYGDRR
jgi:hypothetical protein